MLAGLLILGAVLLYVTNYKEVHEINIFAVVLLVQSLPFIAAAGLAVLERTPVQRFRHLAGARSARARTRRPAAAATVRRRRSSAERRESGAVANYPGSAVSTSFTQYEVPSGITSSLKLYDG